MTRAMGVGLALALLAASLPGCAEDEPPLPPEWKGRDLRRGSWSNDTLQPGWTLALEYHWAAGTRVEWDWFTPQEQFLYFRLVRMEGSRPVELIGRHALEDKSGITVPQSGAYQMLWIDDAPMPIALTAQSPEGAVRTLHPPGQGPGCAFLASAVC